jgi:hypothetical protein
VEVSGTFSFGNNRQTLATAFGALAYNDSTVTVRGDVRFIYGEGATEERGRAVTQRSWLATLGMDWFPHATHSPFVHGGYESSLERRIRSRVSAGAGSKVTFLRTPRSRLDFSLALLAERSVLPTDSAAEKTEELARWSARVRARRAVRERLELSHTTFYRPELYAAGRFTFSSTSSAAYKVSRRAELRVSYLDNYDSEARRRGARSNNDGQLVVGVSTSF